MNMKRLIIITLILFGSLSCISRESQYKDVKIQHLTTKVDSLEEDNHQLQLRVWTQDELIYSQDTAITGLEKQLKK